MPAEIRPRSKSLGLPGGLAVALLLAAVATAGDEPGDKAEGSRDLDPVTKEHLLAKVPNFFCYDYPFRPAPGKRLWLRVDDKTFVERYPDGTESRFTILGRAKVREMAGVVVAKSTGDPAATQTENDGGFQVFVPDKDAKPAAILFRNVATPNGLEWKDMAWSTKRPTEPQKVE